MEKINEPHYRNYWRKQWDWTGNDPVSVEDGRLRDGADQETNNLDQTYSNPSIELRAGFALVSM